MEDSPSPVYGAALLMRFGGNTIRGSNPRSSARDNRQFPLALPSENDCRFFRLRRRRAASDQLSGTVSAWTLTSSTSRTIQPGIFPLAARMAAFTHPTARPRASTGSSASTVSSNELPSVPASELTAKSSSSGGPGHLKADRDVYREHHLLVSFLRGPGGPGQVGGAQAMAAAVPANCPRTPARNQRRTARGRRRETLRTHRGRLRRPDGDVAAGC
jgi:hypothetical protein